jgi:hypothetical protein
LPGVARVGLLTLLLVLGSFYLSLADSFICPPNDKIVSTGDNMYTVQGLDPLPLQTRGLYMEEHAVL